MRIDVAMESAGVTLISGDSRRLVTAIALSRATMRNIRENLFWAFACNVVLVPNALRLRRFRPPRSADAPSVADRQPSLRPA